ncbi:hypothetical protein LIA77_07041 [Sarocladium implicatum]|nr:hypothetical protein LIA77_07041 [Sarocladium implicatum]
MCRGTGTQLIAPSHLTMVPQHDSSFTMIKARFCTDEASQPLADVSSTGFLVLCFWRHCCGTCCAPRSVPGDACPRRNDPVGVAFLLCGTIWSRIQLLILLVTSSRA